MGFNYEDSQRILFVFLENLANIKNTCSQGIPSEFNEKNTLCQQLSNGHKNKTCIFYAF